MGWSTTKYWYRKFRNDNFDLPDSPRIDRLYYSTKKIGSMKLSYPTLRQRSDPYSKSLQNRPPGVQLGGSLASSVFTRPCPNGLSPTPFIIIYLAERIL
uniref:HTH_48 domain-containing protein n=1 Tax=Strongyloides papillosus TaxID=174720 RepID=A0A0N5C4U9_STREA